MQRKRKTQKKQKRKGNAVPTDRQMINKQIQLLTRQKLRIFDVNRIPPRIRAPKGSTWTSVFQANFATGNFLVPFTTAVAALTAASYQFTLSDIVQSGSVVALFDQYRIDQVDFYMIPVGNALNSTAGTVPAYAVVDRDDNTLIASLAAIQEYDNVQQIQLFEGLHVRLNPTVTVALNAAGSFSGLEVKAAPFVDVGFITVPHYGIKVFSAPTGAIQSWNIKAYYRITFLNSR